MKNIKISDKMVVIVNITTICFCSYSLSPKTSYEKSIEKLQELRNSLPDKYQKVDKFGNKIGNVAYSDSDIAGYDIDSMKAFSKYGSTGQNGIKSGTMPRKSTN